MRFEVFDRAQTAPKVPAWPVVQVAGRHRLLFNRPAWSFLSQHSPDVGRFDVSLVFDAEVRCAGVQPVLDDDVPQSARFRVVAVRSPQWPWGVNAAPFIEFWQVADGEYPAKLIRGPGPRMVEFEVGRVWQPSAVIPGVARKGEQQR
jgi:hypothetical protein